MRIRLLLILTLVISGFLASVNAQVRVLPLGDSITQGNSSYNTYRRLLWKMLINSGYSVDFIGSAVLTVSGTLPPNPDFDLEHEGHSGWRADEIASHLPTWLASYTPDVVLLHIGSNDAIQNHGGASYLSMTVNDITQIIGLLRADNPNVRILLAKIIGVDENWTVKEPNDFHTNERIDALNAEIINIAATQSTVASPILVVDHHTDFQPTLGVDTYDGVHPNERGEAKMAEKWYQAFQTIFPRAQTSFHRGINVGGSQTVVDGRAWDGQGAANYSSVGTPYTYPSVAFNPTVSSDRATMLCSFIYGTDVQLTLNSVPNGSYDVYVWTFEDNATLTSNLSMEGSWVATYTSGPAGRWDRLGPFRANVEDGDITVRFQSTSADQCIVSGLEVWQLSTSIPTPPPPPVRTLTVNSSNPGTGVSVSVDPADENGNGAGTTSFTRSYVNGTVVSLEAPAALGGNLFRTWKRNGVDYGGRALAVIVTVDGDVTMTAAYSSTVQGAYVFYNNSAWDGNNPAANANDDNAIAPDKTPLLPGGKATFANYTSYSRGLNGIMVDISSLPGTPAVGDFILKVGNTSTPQTWVSAPAPNSVTVVDGGGVEASDRVKITWPDGAIRKKWVEVTVLATDSTGLAQPYVFYFGNAVADTGNSSANADVTTADVVRSLNNFTLSAPIASIHDLNRDKLVATADVVIALNNFSLGSASLQLIDLGGSAP